MTLIEALIVFVFLLIHIFGGRLRFLDTIPRSRWLSMAGGISVAYVFLHIFPELAASQEEIAERWRLLEGLEHHVYLVALVGLSVFYGLERLVKSSREREATSEALEHGSQASRGVFWLHIASFAIYNALIGYLLVHREEQSVQGLLLFAFAIALHFLVNDYGLRQEHENTYQNVGRWVLVAAIVTGWVGGLVTEIPEAAVAVLFAFVAGGIVLNVLKEELPEERKSRFLPFALGTAAYAVILLLL